MHTSVCEIKITSIRNTVMSIIIYKYIYTNFSLIIDLRHHFIFVIFNTIKYIQVISIGLLLWENYKNKSDCLKKKKKNNPPNYREVRRFLDTSNRPRVNIELSKRIREFRSRWSIICLYQYFDYNIVVVDFYLTVLLRRDFKSH